MKQWFEATNLEIIEGAEPNTTAKPDTRVTDEKNNCEQSSIAVPLLAGVAIGMFI